MNVKRSYRSAVSFLILFQRCILTTKLLFPILMLWCATAEAQYWSPVPSMSTGRVGLAVTAGPDGRIYALGGYDDQNRAASSVEAFDPQLNRWLPVAPMSTARWQFAAATGSDGKIYAIGGFDGNGNLLSSVEAYDPASNTWSRRADLPFPCAQLAATAGADGKIYAIGGENANGDTLSTMEAYDPAHNTWTSLPNMRVPRHGLAAATGPDGRIYALAGIGAFDYNLGVAPILSTAEVYDPATASWTAIAPLPVGKVVSAAVTGPDGRIYFIGGAVAVGNEAPVATVYVYHPDENLWYSNGDMPTWRFALGAALGPDGAIYTVGGSNYRIDHMATVEKYNVGWYSTPALRANRTQLAAATGPDGRIYTFGGLDVNFSVLATTEAYDPTAGAWISLAKMPTARYVHAVAAAPDGKIYLFGGADNDGNLVSSVDAYDPVRNIWTSRAPMPTPRLGLAAVTGPDGKIYVFGGEDANWKPLSTVEAYDPVHNTWTTRAKMPTARFGLAASIGPDGKIYAIGGQDGGNKVFSTVEAYDPAHNLWTSAYSLFVARSFLSAAFGPDGKIYAIGGQNSNFQPVATVETLAPGLTPLAAPNLQFPVRGMAAAVGLDGRIYAIGGDDSSQYPLANVEAYAPETLLSRIQVNAKSPYFAVVTLGAPAPDSGLLMTLQSGDPSSVGVPTTLFVPPGETSSGFYPSLLRQGSGPVALSATYQGHTVVTYLVSTPNPTPTLTNVSPNAIQMGRPSVTLDLYGANFNLTSVAKWNGVPLSTHLLSSAHLTAFVPDTFLMKSGSVKVTVSNPAPGGGASSPVTVNIGLPKLILLNAAITPGDQGGFQVHFVLENNSIYTASAVQIASAVLGNAGTNSLFPIVGDLAPGAQLPTYTFNFPSTAGKHGATATFTLSGVYSGGVWKASIKFTLP